MRLQPVIARFSRALRGRRGVDTARQLGRAALEQAAALARMPERTSFPRDRERAPLPFQAAQLGRAQPVTWHWSTTNTPGLTAAVVAPERVGIDAEWLDRPRLGAAREYLDADERRLLGMDERRAILALWSAKESVLKLTGIGMAGMGRTRLEGVLAQNRLVLSLDGEEHRVFQFWQGEYVLSLACDGDRDAATDSNGAFPAWDFDVRPAVLVDTHGEPLESFENELVP